MKHILKLEELGLLIFFSLVYFQYYEGSWGIYFALFFLPDLSFVLYLVSKKSGAVAYNLMHHKGIMALVIILGWMLNNEWIIVTGLIFMAHSCFDRVAGYGLKYFDSFDHTHLGWIGKSKTKNIAE